MGLWVVDGVSDFSEVVKRLRVWKVHPDNEWNEDWGAKKTYVIFVE